MLAQMGAKGGAEGAGKLFWRAKGGKDFLFSPPCVCTQNAQIFVQNSNVGEGHENKTSDPLTRPPSRLLAAGPSICHPSLEGGRGGPEAAMREAFRGSHPEDTGLEALTASRP